MSMTDGTARSNKRNESHYTDETDHEFPVLELIGNSASKRDVLPRLIRLVIQNLWMQHSLIFKQPRSILRLYLRSMDDRSMLTSVIFNLTLLTSVQRPGGSDVSQTETKATATGAISALGPEYKLNGFKWFSSATDSNVSLALARTGDPSLGSRSLSLFLVPLRVPLFPDAGEPAPNAVSNGILVHRLKNKIGTHSLPTAELSLNNTTAYLVGAPNQGVKNITPVLNITRVYSALSSVSYLRKCMAISIAYANVRTVSGGKQLLKDTPVHISQLASIQLTYRALTHLIFGTIHLLGKSECGSASNEEHGRLRLLTPIVKAFAAEKCCAAMEDAMTTLGGQGYMEENGIGRWAPFNTNFLHKH